MFSQMSNLSGIERIKLEKLLEMSSGYVLNFSDRTFDDYVLENTGLNIYEDKYIGAGTSKAKRLRSFWRLESNHIVGKLLLALLEYWKSRNTSDDFYQITEDKQKLFDECFQISQRLVNDTQLEEIQNSTSNILFEKIQNEIIKEIEQAKFTIWIAVAWFTDKKILDKLIVKKQEGLNIQLIICDDEINNNSGLDYTNFETYKVPKTGKYENIMHNKFCVIDLNRVIHGSYNWTNKAKFNGETIDNSLNRQEAEKFAEQFIKLKRLAS
ncbi:phospholipase D-like domain-containing protein [Nostoc sp. NMS4]|uniref:phospholipase D-like domain-containing protein n=2 Tax=unclassified Nostoc TaxID=2593658 RepID=UPI0025F791C7|nr:phospholipase D-like domain-containing protein [Nostoc sp. NMS4]MBN3924403.1 hypothetical protein [Nostoc sp. NMS4]